MSKIIILGGHGAVAMIASRKLTKAGHQVTSVIRSPEQKDEIEATGATPLVLDLRSAEVQALDAAVAGHDAVVWAAGAGGASAEATFAVDRDAAQRSIEGTQLSGVKRYVMLSYQGSTLDHGLSEDDGFYPYVQAKAEADEALRRSALDWTILGPGYLTDDEPTGTIGLGPIEEFGGDRQSAGPNGERSISRSDVAQTIVDALDLPETIGKVIEYGRGDTPIREALAR